MSENTPIVGFVMGSDSDWPVIQKGTAVLEQLGVPFEARVLSAHRTPHDALEWAQTAADRGLKVIIAAAGMAAHLPGVVAASTLLPVIGVPIQSGALEGVDALYSIVQMPPGIPVATVGIGRADNAALLAVHMMAIENDDMRKALEDYRSQMRDKVRAADRGIQPG